MGTVYSSEYTDHYVTGRLKVDYSVTEYQSTAYIEASVTMQVKASRARLSLQCQNLTAKLNYNGSTVATKYLGSPVTVTDSCTADTWYDGPTLSLSKSVVKGTETLYPNVGINDFVVRASSTSMGYVTTDPFTISDSSFYVPRIYYTVSYNANGGTGSVSSQTKYHGDTLTLRSNSYTRTNYVFKEWNTASGGTGTSYSQGGSYTANSSATMYAQWYAPYTVAFDANGGSGAPTSQLKVHGTALTLSSTVPVRTNYSFYHWNTNASNTGTSYSPSGSYTANSAATLYAIWNPIISFNANGGSAAPEPQTKTYGTALTLTTTKPTRSGYRFKSWNTSSSGSGTTYSSGGSYTSNDAATLYAQWRTLASVGTLTVTRCDSSGNSDPLGAYITCSATWSVDSAISGSKMTFSCGSTTSQVNLSGASGTATSGVMSVSGKPYNALSVTATVTDSEGYTGSRTVVDTTAYTNPAITSVQTVRTDSQGNLNDEGAISKYTVNG